MNQDPVAEDDYWFIDEDVTLSALAGGGVLTNDSDPDNDALMASLISGPENGFVVLNSDGSFDYTPDANFFGSDSFIYEASDGNGGTDTATVFIDVLSVNDDPDAMDDFAETDANTPIDIYVLANDTDVDLDDLTIQSFDGTTLPGVTVDYENGFFTFDPSGQGDFSGVIFYTVSDGNGGSDTATVFVTVNGVSDIDML